MSGCGLRASLVTILKRDTAGLGGPSADAAFRTPGHRFVMRVWIALPKKAALYTMKFQPEQCLKRTSDSHVAHHSDLAETTRGAAETARLRGTRRRRTRHDWGAHQAWS